MCRRPQFARVITTMLEKGLMQLMAEANAVVAAIPAHEALGSADDPQVVFVDVRESVERQAGSVRGSVHAPRGFLEFLADPHSPSHLPALSSGKTLVVFCASGGRSALAAKTLIDMGVANVTHLEGGYAAWRAAGGPSE